MIARRRGISYAWAAAGASFVTLLAAAGFRSMPGVLFVPLEQEFGWNRATGGVAVPVNLLFYGFAGPFAAALMERFGSRRVVAGALLTIAADAIFGCWRRLFSSATSAPTA